MIWHVVLEETLLPYGLDEDRWWALEVPCELRKILAMLSEVSRSQTESRTFHHHHKDPIFDMVERAENMRGRSVGASAWLVATDSEEGETSWNSLERAVSRFSISHHRAHPDLTFPLETSADWGEAAAKVEALITQKTGASRTIARFDARPRIGEPARDAPGNPLRSGYP